MRFSDTHIVADNSHTASALIFLLRSADIVAAHRCWLQLGGEDSRECNDPPCSFEAVRPMIERSDKSSMGHWPNRVCG